MFKRPEDTDIWDDLNDEDKAFMTAHANALEYQATIAGLEQARDRLAGALTSAFKSMPE